MSSSYIDVHERGRVKRMENRTIESSRVRASYLSTFWGEFLISCKYVWTDLFRQKRNFWVATSTIFMTVVALVVAQALISKGPLVFIKVTENMVGEYDFVMVADLSSVSSNEHPRGWSRTGGYAAPSIGNASALLPFVPGNSSGAGGLPSDGLPVPRALSGPFFLNSTYIHERISSAASDAALGAAPRWTLIGRAGNRLIKAANTTAILLLLDTERERELRLGRAWPYRALRDGEALVSAPLLRSIGVEAGVGERIRYNLSPLRALSSLGVDDAAAEAAEKAAEGALGAALRAAVGDRAVDVGNATAVRQELDDAFNVSLPLGLVEAALALVPERLKKNGTDEVLLRDLLSDAVVRALVDGVFGGGEALLQLEFEATVVAGVEDPSGKWPQVLGNVVLMEAGAFPLTLAAALPPPLRGNARLTRALLERLPGYRLPEDPALRETVDGLLTGVRLADWAMQCVVPFRHRLDAYMQSEGSDRTIMVSAWGNQLVEAIGWDEPLTYKTPVASYLLGLDIVRAILQTIYNICIVILFFYAGMVIYALMQTSAMSKTYDFGMLRALGLRHGTLLELMALQALCYAVPAVAVGVLVSVFVNAPLQYAVASYALSEPDYSLDGYGVFVGCLLGFCLPLVANIVPIRRALSQTLRDALDLYHTGANDTVVKVERLESLGVDPMQMTGAVVMAGLCFIFLYLYPWAFQFLKFSWVFFMTDMIFIGLLIGLAMVFGVMQQWLEPYAMRLVLWPVPFTRKLVPLIRKALGAHRDRNRKTAIMVTTVACFTIFAGMALELETRTLLDGFRVVSGSDVLFLSTFYGAPLNDGPMREFLETQMENYQPPDGVSGGGGVGNNGKVKFFTGAVKDYTFIPFPMNLIPGIDSVTISNAAGHPFNRLFLFSVEKNFLKVIFNELVVMHELDEEFEYETLPSGLPDFVQSMYDDRGRARLAWDEGLETPRDPRTGSLQLRSREDNTSTYFVPYDMTNELRDERAVYGDYLDAVISSAEKGGDVMVGKPILCRVQYELRREGDSPVASTLYSVKARAALSKSPSFLFSWVEDIFAFIGQPMWVTTDAFAGILEDVYQGREKLARDYGQDVDAELLPGARGEIPPVRYYMLLVRLVDDFDPLDREFVINGLRSFVPNDSTLVSDTTDMLSLVSSVMVLLKLFFYTGILIFMILCFFVLWVSCHANVVGNVWEIGVLRAVGVTKREIIAIFMCESMTLTLSSVASGTVIGSLLGFTLSLENDLFGDWPIRWYFPLDLFLYLCVVTIGVTLVGSYLPARRLAEQPIAKTLKGGGVS